MKNGFFQRNEGFITHYLEWKPLAANGRLPIVCVHGNLTNARMFQWIGNVLSFEADENAARHVFAIDIRGRGDSGMPENGFTLTHMASDIEAVMEHLGVREAHFIAYSRGVTYALQFAQLHPGAVRGLVIGDFPPYCSKFQDVWAQKAYNSYKLYDSWDQLYDELKAAEGLSREQFEARREEFYTEDAGWIRKRYSRDFPTLLQRESEDCDLAPALENIAGDTLILKGNEQGSLLKDEQLKAYQTCRTKIVRVNGAGHDVLDPRPQVTKALVEFFEHAE